MRQSTRQSFSPLLGDESNWNNINTVAHLLLSLFPLAGTILRTVDYIMLFLVRKRKGSVGTDTRDPALHGPLVPQDEDPMLEIEF